MGTRARISRRSSIWSKSPFQGGLEMSRCRSLLAAAPTAGDCAGPGEVGAFVAENFARSAEKAQPASKASAAVPPTATATFNNLLEEQCTTCHIAILSNTDRFG